MLRDTLSEWMATAQTDTGSHGKSQRQPGHRDAVIPTPPIPLSQRQPNAVAVTASDSPNTSEYLNPTPATNAVVQLDKLRSDRNPPEEPRFIGPTRSAYSIEAGERALSRSGIPPLENPFPSGQQTPAGSPRQEAAQSKGLFWANCDCVEFSRLISIFQEEVESIYPCLETGDLVQHAAEVVNMGRLFETEAEDAMKTQNGPIDIKALNLARLAIATVLVIEGHGTSQNSTMLVAPVERSILSVLEPSRTLMDLQLLILLSIYYFHCDQDLLAWRSIGLAAREALVMGLHRKPTLLETYSEPGDRNVAVRVFWTIYILDRRWSFGTSLSFALVDRDIDAALPEPGDDCPYLQCMVGYGRLCSVLWDALVPFNHRTDDDTDETMRDLDIKAQEWLESIPSELRLRHPRLGLAAKTQPPVLQRLRALLYLRGNHSRILIYRYYLLGPGRIRSSYRSAWLAVEIAQDSIQVLVHLNDSSNIYRRQQAAFNYFLVSALAVLFLAVCNDPETFAAPCKQSLHVAINLLRDFSQHSWGSRRLWRSVRGIVPWLRRLELRREEKVFGGNTAGSASSLPRDRMATDCPQRDTISYDVAATGDAVTVWPSQCAPDPTAATAAAMTSHNSAQVTPTSMATPDFNQISNELIGLFETFEQGQVFTPQSQSQPEAHMANGWGNGLCNFPNFVSQDQGAVSWQFDWLIQ